MKKQITLYLIMSVFFITSCMSDNKMENGLVRIDVRKNYPEKEIFLTDIADVIWLHLDSDCDDYLYQGSINCITENTVVVVDNSSGSILFFSKDGIPRSHFNRRGQGPEEYIDVRHVIYDETADELFVSGFLTNVIQVYSSIGEHKRSIILPRAMLVEGMIFFDDHSLFLHVPNAEAKDYAFYCISKTDGEVLDSVKLLKTQTFLGVDINNGVRIGTPANHLIKCPEGVFLCSEGTDTVFLYNHDKSLIPVLLQTPSSTSLDPVEFLDNYLDTGQYQFIKVVTVRRDVMSPFLFPAKYYVRDKKTGEVFRQKNLLPDYKGKEIIISPGSPMVYVSGIYEDGYWLELDLIELKEAFRENKLSGKLKELVATLNEDEDNNVFMLVNFK